MKTAQHVDQTLHLDHVTHPGRGTVTLNVGCGRRGQAGVSPRAFDGQPLANGIGRGDALPFSIARPTHAAQHGIDPISITLGIG